MSNFISDLGLSSLAFAGVFSLVIGYVFIVATALLVSVPIILTNRKENGEKSAG